MSVVRISVCILLMLSTAPGGYVHAQEGSRERELLKRAQSALQRSEQDKAKLQEDKAKLEQEKNDLSGKLKSAERTKRELAAARRKEIDQEKALGDLRQQLDASKAKAAQLEIETKEKVAALHESDERTRQLSAHVKELDEKVGQQLQIIGRQLQMVQACSERNAKLAELGNELLQKYRSKGVWAAMAQQEPFTGIEEVRMQSLLQDYRDKIGDLKIDAPGLHQ